MEPPSQAPWLQTSSSQLEPPPAAPAERGPTPAAPAERGPAPANPAPAAPANPDPAPAGQAPARTEPPPTPADPFRARLAYDPQGRPLPRPEPPQQQSWLKRKFGPVFAAIAAFIAKFKTVILLVAKFKLFTTAGTMLVSVAAYSVIFGWQFAIGFVLLLLVHEMGHVIALRREGIKASAPFFIPFLGAVISARSLGENALAEARVGLAGPILGSIGSAACILIWHATGSNLWRALAFTGFFLNLFNLMPVVPLDGGRAMAAMSPWMWFLGFAGLIAMALLFPNPIILIILIFGAIETHRRWKLRKQGGAEQEAYYRVKPLDRVLVGGVYLSLIALLVVGMTATNLPRTFG